MSTVYEAAALLPDPAELRVFLRALAVLDATIGDDPHFVEYVFDTDWGPGEEAALMDNGSGDDFSVLFTPAGVLIRGFDHESEMSPYGRDDKQVWPGVVDEVPAALRPALDDPAFTDAYLGVTRVTVCLWRETGDTAWRAGSAIDFPALQRVPGRVRPSLPPPHRPLTRDGPGPLRGLLRASCSSRRRPPRPRRAPRHPGDRGGSQPGRRAGVTWGRFPHPPVRPSVTRHSRGR